MRAVFTVKIPPIGPNRYPTDEEFLLRVRSRGWEDRDISSLGDEAEKKVRYQEKAKHMWDDMPEIAVDEKKFLIFYGYMLDTQTEFVITRRNDGQATFRLLQPDLYKLQASTLIMLRALLSSDLEVPPVKISGNSVKIYEKGQDHKIIEGRVVDNPLREAVRTNNKDILLAVIPLILAIASIIALPAMDPLNEVLYGTVERFSTAMFTSTVISSLGFLQTWYEIKSKKLVDWRAFQGTT